MQITGDFTLTTTLTLAAGPLVASNAGIMARTDLTQTAPFVYLAKYQDAGGGGLRLITRAAKNGAVTQGNLTVGVTGAVLIRLNRAGNIFTASLWGGSAWTSIDTANVGMTDPVYIGTAANSAQAGSAISPTFANVNIQNIAGSSYTDSTVVAGQSYSYSVSARDQALNSSGPSGSVSITIPAVTQFGFPRLYGQHTGGGQNAAAFTAQCAERSSKMHIVALGFYYENAGASAFNGTANAFCTYLKTRQVANGISGGKVVRYYIPDSTKIGANASFPALYNLINGNNWMLYKAGAAGTLTVNYFDAAPATPTLFMSNMSTYVPSDAQGYKVADRTAKFMIDYGILGVQGGSHQANDFMSQCDGLFMDGFALRTTAGDSTSASATYAADWNRDGTPDTQTQVGPPSGPTIDQAFRDGSALGPNYVRNAGKLFVGNVAGWGYTNATNRTGNFIAGNNVNGVDNLLHAGMMEGLIGVSWSNESFGGFALAKSSYQFVMAHLDPNYKYGIVHQALDSQGRDFVNKITPYQAAIYGITLALMDNGFYCPSGNAATWDNPRYGPLDWPWIDEFCVDSTDAATGEANSANGIGYLGQPLDAAWPAPLAGIGVGFGNGLYVRRFFNAVTGKTWAAICNPRGNGAQTFNYQTWSGGHQIKRIAGTQVPARNSGATGSSVSLADHDGIIVRVL